MSDSKVYSPTHIKCNHDKPDTFPPQRTDASPLQL